MQKDIKGLLLLTASHVGSSERLALQLGVSYDTVRAWMRGEAKPPADIKDRLLALLEGPARAKRDRR